ncbi:uncharacterized protein [Antedon mediterranea]|uniref:uncharacterized protein n=1 Tax=Antedon mediterranea TaxID=105859 RepID=UPI003AF7E164
MDPTPEIADIKVAKCVSMMVKKHSIDPKIGPHLAQVNPVLGRFYFLPKIHKAGNPGKPIISGIGNATEKISEYVDDLLRSYVIDLPSYIQDSTDFIRKINQIQNLPNNTVLATLDASMLYTNIPHEERANACILNYKRIQHFLFLANFLSLQPNIPLVWFRYIDDIFIIWTHGEDNLGSFLLNINSAHPIIKFTATKSTSSVDFLDTIVTIENGTLKTDLFHKPTDKNMYLLPISLSSPTLY